MNTLYVRVRPKSGVSRFFRCGIKFTTDWQKLEDLDTATAKRLRSDQMLEVEAAEPEGFAQQEEGEQPVAPSADDSLSYGTEVDKDLQAIRDAIANMDRENAALWTSSGKPKTEAISAVLGWNVSAMERDAALAQSAQELEQQ